MVLDIETNGLPLVKSYNEFYNPKSIEHYESSRIVEIGYEIYSKDGVKLNQSSSLIKPDNFKVKNHDIHGITHEMAEKNGHLILEVLRQVEDHLENVKTLVGHNIMFDISVILSECYRYNYISLIQKLLSKNIKCTMKLGKAYLGISKDPSLIMLYRSMFKNYIIQTHRALDDVKLCAKCYFVMEKIKLNI